MADIELLIKIPEEVYKASQIIDIDEDFQQIIQIPLEVIKNGTRLTKEHGRLKDHIRNLSEIMDSMPDDTCGDWRDSIAYAIENLSKDDDTSDNIDQIKKEFINRYPKNRMDKLYLDGRSCHFSLNEVLNILDKYKKEKNT